MLEGKYLISISVVLLLVGFVALDSSNNLENSDSVEIVSDSDVMYTDQGTKYVVDPSRLRQGCPSRDCIPSIDDPKYVAGDKIDWMESGEKVLGVEKGNESIAFPLKILAKHEIVNTEISDKPIVATYCPLCRSGVVYSRNVDNQTLEFGVSGKLLNANLVMYDRQTESYWGQIQGKAIVGPKTPQNLDLMFSSIANWSSWKKGNPNTLVLSRETGIYSKSSYESNPYDGYADSESVGFGVDKVDGRLGPKEIVHGIKLGNSSKAYPEKFIKGSKVINDVLGSEPIAVFRNPKEGGVVALRVDTEENITLRIEDQSLISSEGDQWSLKRFDAGSSEKIERLSTSEFYWFAWTKFNPNTKVYRPLKN